MRVLPLLAALTALSACASSGGFVPPAQQPPARPPEQTQVPPTRPQLPQPTGPNAPQIMNVPGLETVIRQDSAGLQRLFGPPRLNVAEGDMRKLQFTGEACVLDIFLYPLAPGSTPVATWVEARRASDGGNVDRAACVRALSRR